MIKILDCTLRDGGYVNNWNFGKKAILETCEALVRAKIDIVELGFFESGTYDVNRTLFQDVNQVKKFIPKDKGETLFYGMFAYSKFDAASLPDHDGLSLDGFRVIFKKNDWKAALSVCKAVKNKGYKLYINPTHTYHYSDFEMLELIEEVNKIEPTGFSIVDTMGIMKGRQLVSLFLLLHNNLKKDISICFHSHNNLQLSFSNAVALFNLRAQREIVVDASILGMGRGAGNLCTELLINYVNEEYNTKYNILPVLEIVDKHIQQFFIKYPWGYNLPFYLAATHECHPNYALYLSEKHTITIDSINSILKRIPYDKKNNYDKELIKRLYIEYQENTIDDSHEIVKLSKDIGKKKVLVFAPGKSLLNNSNTILSFISENDVYTFSLNSEIKKYNCDKIFVTNAKRFLEQNKTSNMLITSNIKNVDIPTLNYSSYLNSSEMYDNSALILLSVLIKIGIDEVYFAGLDGFSSLNENYYDSALVNNAKLGVFDKRNTIMQENLKKFSKMIKINFLTPTIYEI